MPEQPLESARATARQITDRLHGACYQFEHLIDTVCAELRRVDREIEALRAELRRRKNDG